MMNRTNIEWARNPDGSPGYTLNDKTGCTNHTQEGLCLGGLFPCYAYKLANGRLKNRYLANLKLSPTQFGDCLTNTADEFHDPFYPRFWEEKLKQPYHIKKPCGIFLDDMSDWMLDCWSREQTEAELQMMKDNPQHRFYTLTKQPGNLIKFSPFPENCWVGVTVTNEAMFSIASNHLARINARIKFYSFEPLLKWDFKAHWDKWNECLIRRLKAVDWLVIGAQTKPYKPPKIEWVREIVEAADKAGIRIFLKDNLLELVNYVSPQTDFAFNIQGDYRQEMPAVK